MHFHSMTSLSLPYRALVIGASGGIGSACVERLENDHACGEIATLSRKSGQIDLFDEESIAQAADRFVVTGQRFDLIFVATGALTIGGQGPEKSFRAIDSHGMAAQFALNAIGPALIIKYFAPLLVKDRKGVMGFLSARVGSIGDNMLGGWFSYRASKAALNQIVHTAAIEMARTRPHAVVVALHPGTVATALSQNYAENHPRFAPDESASHLLTVMNDLTPKESGGFFAYDGSTIPW
ncbi:SDR family NAD(P)-dependent oxidoreductase [Allorhizobium sp. BGMRC 0089]|uniref:SDR family NAD(P)-dependent oxidoreductase n=1 Tax=Allorhizobium sonneratiae TaxID=2934936 RepID=UPI002033B4A1|nr:SDR family NAD(P)-dependent oxidoreductase [Allorhizobium sonneratiae]MCM2293967.1 SDR family NAD(P)-dependent oxidoreductase [Allorhizobium sonneratiae]